MEEPRTPYRDGKPLADLIPPDRRRVHAAVLVAVSMFAGAALFELLKTVGEHPRPSPIVVEVAPGPAPQGDSTLRDHLERTTLTGPDGARDIPSAERFTVVHVWREACQDCMPAFEAMRALELAGGLGLAATTINVSYGEADPAWAARYGVRENLVYDEGGARVVRPLGIGTFTTLVVDASGRIVHRDRPDRPGFEDRLRAVVGGELPREAMPDGLTSTSVQALVHRQQGSLRRVCWDATRKAREAGATADVNVTVGVDPVGRVTSVSSSGSDPVIAKCVEGEVAKWVFPTPASKGAVNTVNIPFHFVTQ